jgi:hypothetical protein
MCRRVEVVAAPFIIRREPKLTPHQQRDARTEPSPTKLAKSAKSAMPLQCAPAFSEHRSVF